MSKQVRTISETEYRKMAMDQITLDEVVEENRLLQVYIADLEESNNYWRNCISVKDCVECDVRHAKELRESQAMESFLEGEIKRLKEANEQQKMIHTRELEEWKEYYTTEYCRAGNLENKLGILQSEFDSAKERYNNFVADLNITHAHETQALLDKIATAYEEADRWKSMQENGVDTTTMSESEREYQEHYDHMEFAGGKDV